MNSNVSNPYASPTATTMTSGDEYDEVKIFSVSGRIGRVRYIGYSVGITLGLAILGTLLGMVTFGIGLFVAYLAIFVITFMLTIQRCHDFNTTGWLSILCLIPFVSLIFWFIPGTDGANNYGNKTPPNSTLAIILACIVPLIAVIGILAAIAIPQYSKYVERARAAQMK